MKAAAPYGNQQGAYTFYQPAPNQGVPARYSQYPVQQGTQYPVQQGTQYPVQQDTLYPILYNI